MAEKTLFDETKLPVGTVAVEADLSEAVADEAPEQAAEEPAKEAEEAPETTETPTEGEQATATETEETPAATEEVPAVEENAEAKPEDAAAEGAEKPAEEKPAETAPAVAAPAAPAVDEELKRSAQWANGVAALMNEDPELRVSLLRSLKRKGQLPQQGEVELAGLETLLKEQQAAKTPAVQAPQKSEAEIAAEVRKLMAQGKELEAFKLVREHDPIRAEVEKLKAAREADERRVQQEAQNAAYQESVRRGLEQVRALAAKNPELVEVSANGAVNFKDKAYHEELKKTVRGLGPDVSLEEAHKYVLFKLGRLSTPATKTVKTVSKPPMSSAPRPSVQKAPAPKVGEVAVEFTVE